MLYLMIFFLFGMVFFGFVFLMLLYLLRIFVYLYLFLFLIKRGGNKLMWVKKLLFLCNLFKKCFFYDKDIVWGLVVCYLVFCGILYVVYIWEYIFKVMVEIGL